VGLLSSMLIEITQLVCNLGRIASIDDLITNTLGAVIGFYIAKIIIKIFYNRKHL